MFVNRVNGMYIMFTLVLTRHRLRDTKITVKLAY